MKRLQRRNRWRFEFLVALALIGAFASVFLERMLRLTRASQRLAAEQQVVLLTSLLQQRFVRAAIDGTLNELWPLADSNPMRLIDQRGAVLPANYAGELTAAEAAQAPLESWYFDRDQRELVYVSGQPQAGMRLRLRVEFDDADGDGAFEPRSDRVAGVYLDRARATAMTQGASRRIPPRRGRAEVP